MTRFLRSFAVAMPLLIALGAGGALGTAKPNIRKLGPELFLRKGCVACHTLDSDPAAVGTLGPDLSGLGQRVSVARIRAILADPRILSATTSMPQLDLSPGEIDTLTTFLLTPPSTPIPMPTPIPRPRPTPTSGF